ncbi:DUF805 domain-containing protein [Paenirhodobacter sp. CAU 1674]|uniref:DUF805 domain-containing protein n=1 Tax=Paenirhodobacter sp. CAU 1674 TaxID=3032596 RepID=UPI0023DC054B|nr:DUF805 domain-containing protein [Paenirhodobacter sp. CAU 1674]MDF2141003.1 DUF805 domain-containing protein [Paenirhodobacter sp. CAU 1674]
MDFQTAVRTCLQKYVTFSGRASRPEYWWFVLFIILGQIILGIADNVLFHTGNVSHGPGYWGYRSEGGPLGGLFALATLLPAIAAGARRLHDTGRSGWWLLLAFLPLIGGLVLLYFFVQPSDPGSNGFGQNPRRGKRTEPAPEPWATSGSIPKVPRED